MSITVKVLRHGFDSKNSQQVREWMRNRDLGFGKGWGDWTPFELVAPELHGLGPNEYNLSGLKQWVHPGQKEYGAESVSGKSIYDELAEGKNEASLRNCLSLDDFHALRRLGPDACEKFLGDGLFPLWRSAYRDIDGGFCVPLLCVDCKEKTISLMSVFAQHGSHKMFNNTWKTIFLPE